MRRENCYKTWRSIEYVLILGAGYMKLSKAQRSVNLHVLGFLCYTGKDCSPVQVWSTCGLFIVPTVLCLLQRCWCCGTSAHNHDRCRLPAVWLWWEAVSCCTSRTSHLLPASYWPTVCSSSAQLLPSCSWKSVYSIGELQSHPELECWSQHTCGDTLRDLWNQRVINCVDTLVQSKSIFCQAEIFSSNFSCLLTCKGMMVPFKVLLWV